MNSRCSVGLGIETCNKMHSHIFGISDIRDMELYIRSMKLWRGLCFVSCQSFSKVSLWNIVKKTDKITYAIASAKTIILRPGYSTVMDLSGLGANLIFVPTPQQTEQEYQAQRLKNKNFVIRKHKIIFHSNVP